MTRSENVSPTAYATGHMWYRLGLSHPGLSTFKGRALDRAFGLVAQPIKHMTGVAFDDLMLARHRGIDAQLDAAIGEGRVTQVIELAAGLSPRGWRYRQQYGDAIRYVETDLPHMVAEKQRLLERAGLAHASEHLRVVNVLDQHGPQSLMQLAQSLDTRQGLAIITEGLMNYLSPEQAKHVWCDIAHVLGQFSAGLYLSDFYLRGENRGMLMSMFSGALQSFVRGRIHVHFESVPQAIDALRHNGFAQIDVHAPSDLPALADLAGARGAQRVRILEAWS